jgi:hypothetical protein
MLRNRSGTYSVTWRSGYWPSFGLEIRFIDHFTTRLVTTSNYSVVADFHTLQITTAHAKSFQSAFTSLFPVTDLNNGDTSTAPTKSSLHRLPYNWLLITDLSRLYHLGTDCVENTIHCCTPTVSVGTCLFAKALLGNGCIQLFIKNLFPISECCFEVVTQ